MWKRPALSFQFLLIYFVQCDREFKALEIDQHL